MFKGKDGRDGRDGNGVKVREKQNFVTVYFSVQFKVNLKK